MVDDKNKMNYTKFWNPIFDAILSNHFKESEIMTLLCIARFTLGFNRPYANLSISFIANSIGHSTSAIKKSLKNLEKRQIIKNHKSPGGKVNQWGINTKVSEWQYF